MRIHSVPLSIIMLAGLAGGWSWSANEPTSGAVALRVSQAPTLDGKLDDKSWSKATEYAGFTLLDSHGKPVASTSVKALVHDKTLFFGFRCSEPEMNRLVAKQKDRDSMVWIDDSIEITLDPTNDREKLYHLIISASGAQYDATLLASAAEEDAGWNGEWQAATSRGNGEWCAEIRLPCETLGITPEASLCMGVNFARCRQAGGQELSTWSPGADTFSNPAHLGELVVPDKDNSYVLVDLRLPQTLHVGKQTTGFTIWNRSKKKIDMRFAYSVTGTANMVGNTEYATVNPGLDAVGSFTLDMGGPGQFRLTAKVEDRKGRTLYYAGRRFDVDPPLVINEALYATYQKRADASVATNVSPEQAAAADLRVSLFSNQSTEPVETKIVKPPLASASEVSFDLTYRPSGMYRMRAELWSGDKLLSNVVGRPIPFKAEPQVGLDDNGFLTVGGKPYFPVGMYTLQDGKGTDHDAVLREASDAGFNTTVFYALTNETVLPLMDAANRNGIRAFVYPTSPFSVAGVENTLANAAKDVAAKKDHPALLGWYIVDEPEGIGKGAVDKTRELYQIVKEADPTHPCSLVIMSPGAAAKYRWCTDIMWIDPYPIPHSPVTYVTSCVAGAVTNVEKDKPVWAIPQAFDWAVWNTGKVNGVHRPTNEEERCMTYLALVHGAKGIIYWAHTASKYYIRDYPEHWAYMKKLAGELHDLTPALLTPNVSRVVGLEPKDAPIDTMVKRLNDRTYVFAVNYDTKPSKVKVSLSESSVSAPVEVLFEERTVAAEKGSWTDEFKPLEVHVYRVAE